MEKLNLRGIDFGPVVSSSLFGSLSHNVRGKLFKFFFRDIFSQITYMTRGVSLCPVDDWGRPRIVKRWFNRYLLVSRRLGNFGIEKEVSQWRARRGKFFIAFISLQTLSSERVYEFRQFINILRQYLKLFNAPVGLVIDTTIHHNLQIFDHDALVLELKQMLDLCCMIQIPVMPHISMTVPVGVAAEIAAHFRCDALSVSSGVPWGGLADQLFWDNLFGSFESPLAQYGNGELYGEVCLPLLSKWVKMARSSGDTIDASE